MWNNSNEKCKELKNFECPYCKENLYMNARSYANHMRWCKYNPNYEKIRKSTSEKLSKAAKLNASPIKEYDLVCEVCGKHYKLDISENRYNKGKYKKTCCDVCAKKLTALHTDKEIKNSKLRKKYNIEGRNENKEFTLICQYCGKEFKSKKKNTKYCSHSCVRKGKYTKAISEKIKYISSDYDKIKILKSVYVKECSFKFALSDYKNEFDFNLVIENGWYSAANKGNNLNGISRDHIFSVMNGFNELIDPYLISHPANCRLIVHTDNISKGCHSLYSYDELVKNVEDWNKKYEIYENKISYDILEYFGLNVNRYKSS